MSGSAANILEEISVLVALARRPGLVGDCTPLKVDGREPEPAARSVRRPTTESFMLSRGS